MTGTIVLIVVGVCLGAMILLWLIGERGRPLRRSTWRMMRAGGLRGMLNGRGLHGYIYGRWTNWYLKRLNKVLPRLRASGKKRLADHYHGKVLTPEQAEAIVTVDREVPLQDLEQIIPYPTARNLVLAGPPDVAAYECACRHARPDHCEPTRVCLVVGQPFVDFTLDHHPGASRRLTREEALELLAAEHERGHVHSAWFKDACLGRFYSICNCCKCCCGGIEAMLKQGVPMLSPSGYVAQVNAERCVACGTCQEVCPFEAVRVDETAAVEWKACMGCGVCTAKCRNQAITLIRDENKGLPLDVRLLPGSPAPA